MKNYKRLAFLFLIIVFGIGLGFLKVPDAQAKVEVSIPQDTAETQIKYPISELGDCQNKSACEQYCGISSNYLACANFGEKNNLISKEDAARAKEFVNVLKGQGPGGCKDEDTCKNYCNSMSNINECVSFAEKHNLAPADQLNEAKQVAKALKEGATLPGNCKDKAACDNYCKSPGHIDECLAFAEKAGFVSPQEAAEAKKVLPLIKRGEAPGQCKTKSECQIYCNDENHTLECVDFFEKAGFTSKEDAAMARKTGGKGPGGCKSKESCDSYCNIKENQKECFNFAKDKDLIPADKIKEIKGGIGRIRSGLDQMPSEAISCLKNSLGEGIIGEIQSGNFMPGPDTSDIIKKCFDKVLPQLQEKLQQGLRQATPETLTCLKSGLGEDGFVKIQSGETPTPEDGDVLKKCFDSMKTEGLKQIKEGLSKMPPEMRSCIVKKIGVDTVNKIESGQDVAIGPEISRAIQNCATSTVDALRKKGAEKLKQAPPEMQSCVKSIMSSVSEKMKNGDFKGASDIPAIIQGCLPQGTKIPSGAGGGINVEFLKKMEEFYGDSLSPKDLDSLKKAREQLKDIIPQGTEIPSGKKIFDLEDIKNTQDEMQEEYKKLTPEELEWIKKAQEQGQFESITPPEIPGDSSGMGM